MAELSIEPSLLNGFQALRWYQFFLSDPVNCLSATHARYDRHLEIANPIAIGARGKHFHVALGEEANREVFGDTWRFRPSGQFMSGPRNSAQRRLRGGLLRSFGYKHLQHRKVMMPPFSKPAVKSYIPVMAELIDQVFQRWTPGEPFDMYGEMKILANWVAASILFGHEDFEQSRFICRMVEEWILLDSRARQTFSRLNLPYTAYGKTLRHADDLERMMHELINQKRNQRGESSDVLAKLVEEADSGDTYITDIDLAAHAVILHGAAFITTASALTWTHYLIAQSPEIAAKLDEEVSAKITDWPPTIEQLDQLELVDQVVREALRLMPPVHHTIRVVLYDCEMLGHPVAKGDRIILSAYFTHRVPEVYDNPSRFDPERWGRIRPNPYQYVPFSAGPRLCLGYQFAMTEMKLVVANIVRRYRLAVVPNSHIDATVRLTFCPDKDIPMVAYPRDRNYKAAPVNGNIKQFIDHLDG